MRKRGRESLPQRKDERKHTSTSSAAKKDLISFIVRSNLSPFIKHNRCGLTPGQLLSLDKLHEQLVFNLPVKSIFFEQNYGVRWEIEEGNSSTCMTTWVLFLGQFDTATSVIRSPGAWTKSSRFWALSLRNNQNNTTAIHIHQEFATEFSINRESSC